MDNKPPISNLSFALKSVHISNNGNQNDNNSNKPKEEEARSSSIAKQGSVYSGWFVHNFKHDVHLPRV